MDIVRHDSNARMSQIVIHGPTVYLAGQVGVPGQSAEAQTRAVLGQIDALLARAGSDRTRLLSATIWLADMADFGILNKVWEEWLDGCPSPARATGEVRLATPDYKVEIIVVAARD